MKKTCSLIVSENYRCSYKDLVLYKKLKNIIRDFGLKNIIAGTDEEIELNLIDFLIEEREQIPDMTITAIVSSEESLINWSEEQRLKFFDLIVNCDREILLSPPMATLSNFYKHLVMVDLSDMVLLLGSDPALEFIIKKNGKKLMRFDSHTHRFIPEINLVH